MRRRENSKLTGPQRGKTAAAEAADHAVWWGLVTEERLAGGFALDDVPVDKMLEASEINWRTWRTASARVVIKSEA